MSSQRSSRVRSSRLGRLSQLGRLAGGIAGGVMSEGARRWSQGQRPALRDLILTPGNLNRVATQLSQLRGAAMKVGQLLSMDSGQVLSPELSDLMARLRAEADTMPASQLRGVLSAAWGQGWQSGFAEFDYRPLAAASIGQVHRAVTRDGERLAIKVQYPGVRESIDSDVDNVATLLRVVRLLPDNFDLTPLLSEAKQQLHREADYWQEAVSLRRYGEKMAHDAFFSVPRVNTELTRDTVLAMQLMSGQPVDRLSTAAPVIRNRIVSELLQLLFRELFEFGCVQTDPNFANYLYDHSERSLVLLDFGAVRSYSRDTAEGYRALLRASLQGDAEQMEQAARRIGYFADGVTPAQRDAVLSLFRIATEPLRHEGEYDFSRSDLASRIRTAGMKLSFEQGYWHSPPMDALFLHRKLAGLYLLAVRLQARVDLRPLRQWLGVRAVQVDTAAQ